VAVRYSEVTVARATLATVEADRALAYDACVRIVSTPHAYFLATATATLGACSAPQSAITPDAPPSADSPDAATPAMWTTEPACSATAADIYTTPALPPLTAAMRGDIVRCALGDLLTAAETQQAMQGGGADVTPTTGVRIVKLSYRTVRSDGTSTVSTATAYLPSTPRALPAPTVLVGRSTSGIADACAPSREAMPQANFAMPFAARGFVTITPDFAGLGNEGTHAYLDNHEQAIELFDAARALGKLVPGAVGAPVAAVGYSQGGGTVLSAQALELSLTGTHSLRAVAAIAPEWPISPRSFGYEDVLRHPDSYTGLAGLSPPVVTVARHYGYAANKLGPSHAGDTFPDAKRASIVSAIESRCTVALGGQLNAQEPKLGDLVDDTFRQQVLACIDGGAGCSGPGAAFHAWMTGDYVTADPAGARVLITQGLADQVMPAAGEAACVVDKLQAEGVTPQICSDATATHDSVLERRIEDVVAWIEAIVDGAAPPTCASQFLPACSR
jgi:predicted esterase